MISDDEKIAFLPELLYTDGRFERGLALVCDGAGRIARLARGDEISCEVIPLKNRAMMPGMVNAHSHAFQGGRSIARVLRRTLSGRGAR